MAKIFFDVAYLYYLTQYLPVIRVLRRRGVEVQLVVHDRPRQSTEVAKRVIERIGLPAKWVAGQEEAGEVYAAARPDWVVFGHGFGYLDMLAECTRSAELHHGIGMKADVYDADLFDMDVRFTEGPHYTQVLGERYPHANLVEVGYAKIDPLFYPEDERPRFDLASVGLDPAKPTVMYAPTAFPSSFGAMPDRWPADFAAYNLIVKAHPFSYHNPRYKSHRRKMARWSRAANVHVVPVDEFDPVPYFASADLLISDASSVLFEFAALDRPVVWCDFLQLPLRYRGPWRYRLERRMDRAIERYADICAHAPSYADLEGVVAAELANPGRFSAKRREYAHLLMGATDGRNGERVADHLLGHVATAAQAVPRSGRLRTAVVLAAGMGTRLQDRTHFHPKGFLSIGGAPIIEESLDRLVEVGIERVVIVTGHCSEDYEDLARRRPDLVELVHNERYADSGSLYSLWLARERLTEDFLLLESDLFYERRALEALLECPDRDATLLSALTDAGDEIYVDAPDGYLRAMSKDRAAIAGEVAGEYVGLSKLSSLSFARLMRYATAGFETSLKLDYETDGFVALAAEHPMACPVVDDLLWGEIDFEAHLERAKRLYPELQARNARGATTRA